MASVIVRCRSCHMQIIPTRLDAVKIVEPTVFGDDRGFFMESWNRQAFEEAGLPWHFVQDNHSRSGRGVLRGLHYQLEAATRQAGARYRRRGL